MVYRSAAIAASFLAITVALCPSPRQSASALTVATVLRQGMAGGCNIAVSAAASLGVDPAVDPRLVPDRGAEVRGVVQPEVAASPPPAPDVKPAATTSVIPTTAPAIAEPNLALGINLSHWYWLPHDKSIEGIAKYFTGADADQLKAAGFTHARVPFEPQNLWDEQTQTLKSDAVKRYRDGITLLTSRGLAAIVDPHPNTTAWADPAGELAITEYPAFWRALAGSLSNTDPALVIFEVMNEPHGLKDRPERWPLLQATTIKAIRAAAPSHIILATGDEWGSIGGLLRLTPTASMLADSRIIYSFHFYDPATFTHQGAAWGAANWRHLKKIPYPPTPESIAAATEATTDPAAKGEVNWYAKQHWDAAKVRGELERARSWGARHGVKVYCGEFGAYVSGGSEAQRLAWLADVTLPLREWNIGYAAWDYSGGFAFFTGRAGARTLNVGRAQAIGVGASK